MYSYFMPRKELDNETRARGIALGKTISIARIKSGLTQENLAIAAKVRVETLKSIECGRTATPNVFIVAKIAFALKGDLNKWLR
jgi:transcriptional regulator with XRE-family HTH domain